MFTFWRGFNVLPRYQGIVSVTVSGAVQILISFNVLPRYQGIVSGNAGKVRSPITVSMFSLVTKGLFLSRKPLTGISLKVSMFSLVTKGLFLNSQIVAELNLRFNVLPRYQGIVSEAHYLSQLAEFRGFNVLPRYQGIVSAGR